MSRDPATVRKRLQERRHQLFARYRGAVDRVEEELDSREIESVENASEQWDARLMSVMSDSDARALRDVLTALVRLDEGAYGTCLVCGQPIDDARLEALPETALCVKDAEAREIEAGPKGPPLSTS